MERAGALWEDIPCCSLVVPVMGKDDRSCSGFGRHVLKLKSILSGADPLLLSSWCEWKIFWHLSRAFKRLSEAVAAKRIWTVTCLSKLKNLYVF